MNYNYVRVLDGTIEFIGDENYEFGEINYSAQFLDSMNVSELASIRLKRTVLLPIPTDALDPDGTYYFNELPDYVEYRPNYTTGVRVPMEISNIQARKALEHFNLYDTINNAIAALDNNTFKIEWEYDTIVRRNNISLTNVLSDSNVDAKTIDEIFIVGATL